MRSLLSLARDSTSPIPLAIARSFHARPGSFACQVRNISSQRRRTSLSSQNLNENVDALNSPQRPSETGRSQDELDVYEHLERFLPPRLRRRPTASHDAQLDIGASYMHLPTLMREFRQTSPPGALSYLAAADDRLEAFAFLAKQLVALDAGSRHTDHPLHDMLGLSPWLQETQRAYSLDVISEEPFVFNQRSRIAYSTPKLQSTIDNEDITIRHGTTTAYQEAIGELWAVLGEIVIRASGLSEQAAQRLMQYVHLVLAQMHSTGLVPSDSYNFDDSNTPKAFRKPPYLHILGSRMMAAMSDASWSLSTPEELSTPGSLDSDFPPVVVEEESSMPYHLRPNVWLEFVLWICVRQGYYMEASRLISAVCLAAEDSRWKILTWDQVLALQPNAHRRQQSWFDRLMSIDEGYSAERPLIEMPPKTLSCEVVIATIEGLLSLGDTDHVRSARRISFYAYCQSLRDRDQAQTLMLNSLVQRLEESSDLDPRVISHLLFQQTQSVATKNTQTRQFTGPLATEDRSSMSTEFADLESSLYVSHTLAAWESMVLHGEVAGALELFENIRDALQLLSAPSDIAHQTHKRRGFTSIDASSGAWVTAGSPSWSRFSFTQIPGSLLASFLQLLVRTDNLDSARILLYHKIFGLRDSVTNATLQPALLQAGVAVGDRELLSTVVQRLDVGLDAQPDDVLCALYEAHVWLGIFDHTARLLEHMSTQRRLPLRPGLVVATACKYIGSVGSEWSDNMRKLNRILSNILNGEYLPPRDPSQPMDYTDGRMLSQLVRIIHSTHPSMERLRLYRDSYSTSQANTPIAVSPDAFNPLLETVAQVQGVDAARKFFEIWCQPSPTPALEDIQDGVRIVPAPFEDEKVVTPTLETVQILLRGPLEDLQAWSQGGSRRRDPERYILKWMENEAATASRDRPVVIALAPNTPHHDLFDWAAQTLRNMGYDDHTINDLIPGTFPHAK